MNQMNSLKLDTIIFLFVYVFFSTHTTYHWCRWQGHKLTSRIDRRLDQSGEYTCVHMWSRRWGPKQKRVWSRHKSAWVWRSPYYVGLSTCVKGQYASTLTSGAHQSGPMYQWFQSCHSALMWCVSWSIGKARGYQAESGDFFQLAHPKITQEWHTRLLPC